MRRLDFNPQKEPPVEKMITPMLREGTASTGLIETFRFWALAMQPPEV